MNSAVAHSGCPECERLANRLTASAAAHMNLRTSDRLDLELALSIARMASNRQKFLEHEATHQNRRKARQVSSQTAAGARG